MPELPEVESFRQFLSPNLVGEKIIDVKVNYWPVVKKPASSQLFITSLIDSVFQKISRKGKYLLFFLDNWVLIVHLRMEGKFLFTFSPKEKCSPYCLLEIKLTKQKVLHYLDFRKFGTFHLEKIANYFSHPGLNRLGLEPFDKKLTVDYLWKKWSHRKIPIKNALLEQKVITGIGNIYASEILFASKIWPWKKLNLLTREELTKIIFYTKKILTKAIQLKGSTISTFQIQNQKGLFFHELKVYAREDQICFVCSEIIVRKKLNGRSTFFCFNCQKKN